MDTPPLNSKKSSVTSSSKISLTPCRRLGLCRPSSSLKKIALQNLSAETTPRQNTPSTVKLDGLSLTKLNKKPGLSDNLNKIELPSTTESKKESFQKVRRCLSTPIKKTCSLKRHQIDSFSPTISDNPDDKDDQTMKKMRLDEGNAEVEEIVSECNTPLSKNKVGFSNETEMEEEEKIKLAIKNVLSSIKEKRKKLDHLKVQDVYAKKHKVEEVRAQTMQWKTAGEEALRYAVRLASDAGYSVTVRQLMNQHNFPQHLMRYDSDEDEFLS